MVITDDDIYALQAHAIATDRIALLHATYEALGYSRRYAFSPVTPEEQRRARQRCADALEMMALTGEQLRGLEAA